MKIAIYGFLLCLLLSSSTAVSQETAPEPQDAGIVFDADGKPFAVVSPSSSLSPRSFTVAAWVKPKTTGDSLGILGIGEPSQFFTFYTFRNATRMLVETSRDRKEYAYATAPEPRVDEWTHYAGSCDGATIRIYRDGALCSERAVAMETPDDAFSGQPLLIGAAESDGGRPFRGSLTDVAIWNRALTPEEISGVYERGALSFSEGRLALWNASSVCDDGATLRPIETWNADQTTAKRVVANPLLNRRDDGYRGIWYYNQRLDNEYVFKYSGGLGTYCANHYPFSVYCPEVDKTFFCYGGTDPSETTLWHEVGVFDHKTGKVSRPTILLDKKTNDAHDNPVISVDESGHIWVFSTSHGVSRPSFIHRSARPYDITEFEQIDATKQVGDAQVPMTNFSYVQMWSVPKVGFVAFFTTYDKSLVADVSPNSKTQRVLAFMTSPDGKRWSEWRPLAAIEIGHYQNSRVQFDPSQTNSDGVPEVKLGTAFNYHPAEAKRGRGVGLNWRTNIYYMESTDLGATWRSVDGKELTVPLLDPHCDALVRNYEDEDLNVYITDLAYDAQNRPIIAYVTSKGFESGPKMGPRYFCVARRTESAWKFSTVCEVDNNYEYAALYVEEASSEVIRLVGSFEDGPQKYNTGGEISQWISEDGGETWRREYQLTSSSENNQCFPRRTINADDEFYAIWAEGNGRRKSESPIRFSTKDGRVYELPRQMQSDWEAPRLIRAAKKESFAPEITESRE